MKPTFIMVILATVHAAAEASAAQAPTPEDTIAAYAEAWRETDPIKRDALLALSWADDGIYQDEQSRYEGRDALAAGITDFFAQNPGASIVLASGIHVHHNVFRFRWEMLDADGNVQMEGMDFGELAEDGRIRKIVGFFGPFPELHPDLR